MKVVTGAVLRKVTQLPPLAFRGDGQAVEGRQKWMSLGAP
jgi:hypothetical protein